MNPAAQFVVATPGRSVCDDNARALHQRERLRFLALGTRRGTAGVPPAHTRLYPWLGLKSFAAAKILPPFAAETYRAHLFPQFDAWVKKQLTPGDHLISSYGYVNDCFEFVRAHGGKTFLDGGNSHLENYWEVISEEHRRWGCPTPPFAHSWFERGRAMLAHTDYVLSPSRYVTESFLARGFQPEQILKNIYPLDLTQFTPRLTPRPVNQPLTLVHTASLSLRKGTPYLLEAFRRVREKIPTARLLLTQIIQDDVKPVLEKFRDLPVEWAPGLPHPQLATHLRTADLFILPSLEDGFARTVTEALACGLPVITTSHTGASDCIQPGVNGEVVPIRDPQAIADAVLKWADKILAPGWQPRSLVDASQLSFENFAREFIEQLQARGFSV
jgi:glycosyltransferase involved in cell wall biosynthesis